MTTTKKATTFTAGKITVSFGAPEPKPKAKKKPAAAKKPAASKTKAAPKPRPKATGRIEKIDYSKVPKDVLKRAKAMAKAFNVPLAQMLTPQVRP